jgi:acyl-CoA oxidase
MMTRFPKDGINPILIQERQKARFDTDLITYMLDGGEMLTKKRREMEALVLQDKFLMERRNYHFLSRPERYSDALLRDGYFHTQLKRLGLNNRAEAYFYGNLVFPNESSPTTLHGAMFVPTIESQGTAEQKEKWLQNENDRKIIGTYAQTELGHGTYVRGLETTATYDPRTEEFIINSPTVTATKWWPGGLGKTSNHAIVMALLFTKGQGHGMHAFVVQLRDINSHQTLPGIRLGDIGPKFGFDTIDNGFLRFDNVRIPRENLLMKNQQVLRDGTYVKNTKSEKLAYGSMIFIRAMVVLDQAAKGLAEAATIAIRYSCVRRQSELKPGEPEPQIIEYQTQQYKLFPQLATAYAFYFAGLQMRETYFMLNYEIQHGNVESLPELHATSSGLKAISSSGAMFGIEQCRLACGGHGYSQASGIPKIYVQATAACTYEGENTVLFLQTARYLVKVYNQMKMKTHVDGESIRYLAESIPLKSSINDKSNMKALVDAYKHRAVRMIQNAVERLVQLQVEGKDPYDAWNLTSINLVKAAEAHCQVYVIETFMEKVSQAIDDNVKLVLGHLFQLYAFNGIANDAVDFIEDGYMTIEQVNIVRANILDLLNVIRPSAVALVDAFDFTDYLLGSILGRYDGNVYETMFNWAASSPLNNADVHEAVKHLKPIRPSAKL